MADKTVIIIGAGIGGLAAGCYAQMNGFKSTIHERHTVPGGVCTGWKRKGYTFDGCMHHLSGCQPGSKLYKMWQELGAMPRAMHYPHDLIVIEDCHRQRFTVYRDLDLLEKHMLEISPQDAVVTREFLSAARRFIKVNIMEMLLASPMDMVGMLPNMGLMGSWGKITLEQLAQRFTHPLLKRAIPMMQYDFPDIPAVVALMFLSGVHTKYLGFPVGGALEFAHSIEKRYLQLGGEIRYRSRVAEILTEASGSSSRALGVRFEDGRQENADIVISNADGHATIYDMLGGRFTNERIDKFYAAPPAKQVMGLNVFLGVKRDFGSEPHGLVLCLPQLLEIGGETLDRLHIENYAFAPEMAPAGGVTLKVTMPTSFTYWKNLKEQGAAYTLEKERVVNTVISALDQRFPGLAQQVEVTDVSTPLTTERFVGSWLGYQVWGFPDQGLTDALSGKGLSRELPGLDNFYMVGQWAGGLGLPNVAVMGRKTIELICKRQKMRFETRVA